MTPNDIKHFGDKTLCSCWDHNESKGDNIPKHAAFQAFVDGGSNDDRSL